MRARPAPGNELRPTAIRPFPKRGGRRRAAVIALVAATLTACGGTEFPTSAGPTTTVAHTGAAAPTADGPARAAAPTRHDPSNGGGSPTTRAASSSQPASNPAPVPAPRPPGAALHALVPTIAALGSVWEDDGDQPTSLDLTSPPPACTAFAAVYRTRVETLVHEFSFGVSADGQYEAGHIAMTSVRAASPAAVSSELAAVARSSYTSCAEATAVRWFDQHQDGTIDSVSAQVLDGDAPAPAVLWRVTIANHTATGPKHPFTMDIGYLGAHDILVKIRITSCGCNPQAAPGAELLPGETAALDTISLRLAGDATD